MPLRLPVPRLLPSAARTAAAASLLVVLGTFPTQLAAQGRDGATARRAAYLELGGAGGLYSLNLDRSVGAGRMTIRGGGTSWAHYVDTRRVGASGAFAGAGRNWDVSELLGEGEGRLIETSAVAFAGTFEDARGDEPPRSGSLVMIVPSVGLRHQPSRGWMLRVMVTPYVPLVGEMPIGKGGRVALAAGLSAGYAW